MHRRRFLPPKSSSSSSASDEGTTSPNNVDDDDSLSVAHDDGRSAAHESGRIVAEKNCAADGRLLELLDAVVQSAAQTDRILSLTPKQMYSELAILANVPVEFITQNALLKTSLKDKAKQLVHELLETHNSPKAKAPIKAPIKSTPPSAKVGKKRKRTQPREKPRQRKTRPATKSSKSSLKQKLTRLIKVCKLPPSIYKGLDKTDETAYVKNLTAEVKKALCKKGVIQGNAAALPTLSQAAEWARQHELEQELAELGLNAAKAEVLRPRPRRRIYNADCDISSSSSESSDDQGATDNQSANESLSEVSVSETVSETVSDFSSDHCLSPR